MPIRINKSHRPTDPNGKILTVGLRLPGGLRVMPVDGPSWRSVAVGVLAMLHAAAVPLRPVTAGETGRVLLAQRDGWARQKGEWVQIEETGWYIRTDPTNAHGYLSAIFGALPDDYGDCDCWVEYEPVHRRPTVRRGSKKYKEDETDLDFTRHGGSAEDD